MKKITAIVTVYLLTITTTSLAQNQVSKSVFASAGDAIKSGDYFVQWTIGEPITYLDVGGDKRAFHGFHIFLGDKSVKVEDISELDAKVAIFPNPVSNNELMVEFRDWTGQVKLSIFDMQGRVLYQKELNHIINETYPIDVSFITEGMYILSLQEKDKQAVTRKFTISK